MDLTIAAAARALREGRDTPLSLLDRCLARIEEYEERVHAWVLIDRERALAEARARADELKRGYDRGPLHGIPVGIKDIIDVFDWPTACGSRLWQDAVARHDAPVVQRLRQAGAVIVGKTVTTQYASFDPPPTRNPWDLSRTPGGSSSGSAAAVACGMCLAALGSQTGGSITRPAAYCGVVGCKPTYGTATTVGVLPLAASMDHLGPLTVSVADASLVMQVIADVPALDWCSPLDALPRPPTLGRPRGLFERLADPAVRAMTDRVAARLDEQGAVVHDVALPAAFEEVIAGHRVVMAVESAQFHRDRMARHSDDYGPCIRSLLEEGLRCTATDYAAAKEQQQRLRTEMAAMLRPLDALLCPATTTPAPNAATTGDPAFNSPWSYTGLPVVNFPVGLSGDGLPLAVQLVGRAGAEDGLFQAAAWCQRALGFTIGRPPVR